MASGTISIGTSGNLSGQIRWSSSANESTGKSSVTATLYLKKGSATTEPTSGTWRNVKVQIGSSSSTTSVSKSVGQSWTSIKSLTATVTHGSDGRASVTISGAATGPSGTSLSGNTVSGSGTAVMDRIVPSSPSTISATGGVIGVTNAVKITINKSSSSFTHTLTYSFGSASGTIVTKTSDSSRTWTPPTSLYAQCKTSKTKSCTITCETFDGNTSIGTNTATCTLSIPAYTEACDVSGTAVTVSPINSNTTVAGWGIYLQGYSGIRITLNKSTLTSKYSADLTGVTIWKEGVKAVDTATYSSFSSHDFGVQTDDGKKSLSVWITDSRGVSSKVWGGSVTFAGYSRPAVKTFEAFRSDASSNPDDEGTYISAKIKEATYSSCGGYNSIDRYRIGYYVSGTWQATHTTSLNPGTYDTFSTIATTATGKARAEVRDLLGNITTLDVTIPQALVALQFANGGKKARFFGSVENNQPDNTLYVQSNKVLTTADFTDTWHGVSYSSGYSNHSSANAVKYRKYGDMVFVRGIATNASEVTNTTDTTTNVVFTLPTGYRPNQSSNYLIQCSNYVIGLATVNTDGKVCLSRFRNGGTGTNLVADSWINLFFNFLVN